MARFLRPVGVLVHGMYREKRWRTWEILFVPYENKGRTTQSKKRMFKDE